MEGPDLDWGTVTPEGYDGAKREALHVLNVNLIGEENRSRVVKFVVARVSHFGKHLPEGSSQRVILDLRGQGIGNKTLDLVRQAIQHKAEKRRVTASIEFLTN
jgi:hypothetical protein